ncbi:DsbE family thiol:disulfide interchange protein [Methyloligella sp. 2.7D]|uniref:DsbE family thiol:disulfide interchange protein n=1 Tax=unclassified Methyloligella TaxID=2625955 RepID=UPI00157BF812|nr:DsbE family thiol:disulfide interchange protein [Methyloligella sp. GL2]QKP76427.1 DsbE family thiol:disulfide interchange protein [Methyloligella sp. GL2]
MSADKTNKAAAKRGGAQDAKPRSGWLWSLPLLVFLGLAGLFWYALGSGDPHRLPSALLDKPVPEFSLPPIEGLPDHRQGFSSKDLATGEPTIVNVWASWCGPCREEHPVLTELSKKPGVRLFGINYKDDPAGARSFLGRFGDPFDRVGSDRTGRVGINWGVYGVPETYVVDGTGKIVYRHIGPLTSQAIDDELLPRIEAERDKAKATAETTAEPKAETGNATK